MGEHAVGTRLAFHSSGTPARPDDPSHVEKSGRQEYGGCDAIPAPGNIGRGHREPFGEPEKLALVRRERRDARRLGFDLPDGKGEGCIGPGRGQVEKRIKARGAATGLTQDGYIVGTTVSTGVASKDTPS